MRRGEGGGMVSDTKRRKGIPIPTYMSVSILSLARLPRTHKRPPSPISVVLELRCMTHTST